MQGDDPEDRRDTALLADHYCINFVEEGSEDGFTAHTNCLCVLAGATEGWLMGNTVEEIKEIMTGHAGEHHSGEAEE